MLEFEHPCIYLPNFLSIAILIRCSGGLSQKINTLGYQIEVYKRVGWDFLKIYIGKE